MLFSHVLSSKLVAACLMSWCALFFDGVCVSALSSAEPAPATDLIVYVGTYTRGTESEGIYRCKLNMTTGELQQLGVTREIDNPSFLEIHASGRFLFCVNEVGDFQGASSGAISAFAISPEDGSLRFLNRTSSGGAAPCHLVIDRGGRNVLVANYTGGSVASLPIGPDGQLGTITTLVQHQGTSVDPRRQKGPHAHSINLDSANQFAVVADLGLDKLLVYRFDAKKGTLTANATLGNCDYAPFRSSTLCLPSQRPFWVCDQRNGVNRDRTGLQSSARCVFNAANDCHGA